MADKIILKRSSILGKRPTNKNIQAGELALNTNSDDPGAFFEVSDGNVVKIGPTAVSPFPPVDFPERGETWYSTSNGTYNVGVVDDAKKIWATIVAPYLGGSDILVFVAPEFFGSSDSPLNDGRSLPFQSLGRALLEVTKLKIKSYLSGNQNSQQSEKYVIQYAPSTLPIYNNPGTELSNFSLTFDEYSTANVKISDLTQFNAEGGGLIIPGNVAIKGFDLKKCINKPTYVPSYRHPGYPEEVAGENQSLSCIFKVAGNASFDNFSVTDKNNQISIVNVFGEDSNAVFKTLLPYGLSLNDQIQVTFSPYVDQSTGTFVSGTYYVDPIDTFTFYLSENPISENTTTSYVPFSAIPIFSTNNLVKLYGSHVLKSAHRLSVFKYATYEELAAYYTKVQKAFPILFQGKVTNGEEIVNSSEYVIVASTEGLYPNNLETNSTRNSSCYIEKVNLRSDYGMTYGDFNGEEVKGFRSIIGNACTAVSIQTDPAAYEVYSTLTDPVTSQASQKWWTLAEAAYYSLPVNQRPASIDLVSRSLQISILNQTPIEKIRYYYQNLSDVVSGQSIGIVDIENDFRHFGLRARNSAYIQAQSIYTIGCAIGVWALNGPIISLTNSTSNFGSIAFKSEGFLGINTIGGAFSNATGFQFSGIQRPLSLLDYQVTDIENKSILSLGARITDSFIDPSNPSIQVLTLSSEFSPCFLLPYSLKPGSAIWVSSTQCIYRGFLATDGGPTILLEESGPGGQIARLRIRSSDSTIPTDSETITTLDIPYIRRFKDPRPQSDRSYQFVVVNTNPNALPPPVGAVMRLNQTSQTIGSSLLRPNVQFDPGTLGGWGRLFTVDSVQTSTLGSSPNYNNVVSNFVQDNKYLMTITAGDMACPWFQSKDNFAQGTYCTYGNRNWYAAENNIWESVYYNANFNSTVGPYKIAPTENCSSYVPASVLERQDIVEETYQGPYAQDPNLESLSGSALLEYNAGTYFRGAMVPYTEYAAQSYYDDDDGTDGMGIILKDQPILDKLTVLVSPIDSSAIVPPFNLPPSYGSLRPSPEVVDFYVLSSAEIENPKQTRSVLKIVQGGSYEYLQVINLVGTRVTAIRLDRSNSLYPDPVGGTGGNKPVWNPTLSNPPVLYVCSENDTPSILAYDPDWANTKTCVYRFFEVMGYSREIISPSLNPQYWGERFFSVSSISSSPSSNGYAISTGEWPLEFNQPSTIIANTHTWAYCGYPFYSQGLPKYQTNAISRKLLFDFLATATWSGRLTVTGINDRGEIVLFGPQREAITSQYYEPELPSVNLAAQQIYKDQPIYEFPGQVVVYMTDDISDQFDGINSTFLLKKAGIPIPVDHLTTNSVWVQLGGITQIPNTSYSIIANTIEFLGEPPLAGTTCDIRVVTSEDQEKTVTVVPLILNPADITEDGSIFTLTSTLDISKLDINTDNTIVVLGGVEQLPIEAYTIENTLNPQTRQITFKEPLQQNTVTDIRAICSGVYWAKQGIYPVAVHPLDDISVNFSNLGQTTFLLTYGGIPINPALVNTNNLLVSIGGVMQIPLHTVDNTTIGSYNVGLNANNQAVIIFQEAPLNGSTSDLRIITNAEFLPCINGRGEASGFLKWGPSLVISLAQEVDELRDLVQDL